MKYQKLFIIFLLPLNNFLPASVDKKDSSYVDTRPAKHYFRNCIYLNTYTSSTRILDNKDLGNYKFSELSLGFLVPLFTKDIYKKDSTQIANFHLLLVGNSMVARPSFSAIGNEHNLSRASLGLRIFYNTGKKNIWFFNASPFLVHDNFDSESASLRYASIFIFNRTVNQKFSYRLGFLKTFLFGNRFILPVIGCRIGPLDGMHLNITLPRNISFHFPLGKYLDGSVFVKPYGGLYNFNNNDSLYPADDKIIQFGRYEVLNGIRLDYSNKNFDFYFSCGITKKNYIALASITYGDNQKGRVAPFYWEKINPATFANIGINYKFGKAKKVYNNYTLYDMYDLNNNILPGDNNENLKNNEIPQNGSSEDIKKIQYRDVQDLIELEDFY